MAHAPGIWFQRAMVIAMTLVPLLVVLWRRAQEGRWVELSPADRNAAWTPPPAVEKPVAPVIQTGHVISARAKTMWYALAAVSLAVCAYAALQRSDTPTLPNSSTQAADVARKALADRGFTVQPPWRVMRVFSWVNGIPRLLDTLTAATNCPRLRKPDEAVIRSVPAGSRPCSLLARLVFFCSFC